MSSELYSRDELVERGSVPLDIDNIHMLLQVEQEQIQKRTFTNWVNAQLAKRRPPCMIVDLFNDFRDGYKLLDLLEVMSGQRFSRERGRGMFQHRSNIEKALSFLQKKSIKLVNINIPDIIDGKPSIILGLIWMIILQYHIEELASCLSFDSRQSSMESLASLDTHSTLSSRSASSSPVPPKGSPLHNRFRVSAKKALLLWVREQCYKAGCSINVKDFKASWRSGVVFLAILYALRPDLVDLTKARTRSNKQNLEEAFCIAEKELRIPRLLEPDDVDVRDPDEKSIMTYVAQFLQYSRDMPVPEEEMQATPDRKAQEVTCWLAQAYDELLEGWDSTEGESYSERYHVFQTFLVSFNEQRRPIMPLLTAMRRTPKLSEEQRALREAWDALSEKLREYKTELDMRLPAPLDTVARWLLRTEGVLTEEQGDPQNHSCAADEAREKQELLKVCLEEMPQQLKTFQSFQNMDEYGNMMVPTDKMDELKRRFTSVRVTAKYHGIKLEYHEHRHTVLDLLGQIRTKLHIWKRPYISPEAVRVLLQEWHEMVNTQELLTLLEAALRKLKQISEKYSSKSALSADYHHVSQQVKRLEEDTAVVLEEMTTAKGIMGRVLSAWDSYSDCLSSLQAWLAQGSVTYSHSNIPVVTSKSMAEWGARHAHLIEVGSFLIELTDPQTSRSIAEEMRKLNMHWAEFVKRNTSESIPESIADIQATAQDLQALIREANLILREPLEAMAGPLRTYRKRLQFIMRKIKEVDLEALAPSPEFSDQLLKLKLATPEVMQTLFEAEQLCAEVQHSVSGLDSRLAELLHWEAEARELYQLLRTTDRQQKHQGQDPRARVIISRGLQLEGQVVTEEQDLQVIIMTSQKNSPLQYLHASAMQERVRAAVAQSQEAIGMLSSLGARRDRSRSPPEASPPSKVFIQAKAKPQHLIESDIREPTRRPETQLSDETFVPKIVVQEYREERMTPPPVPLLVQPAMQTGTKLPPEDQTQTFPETASQPQLKIQEQSLISQELVHQGLTIHTTNEVHKQKSLELEKLLDVQEQELKPMQPLPYQQQLELHQVQQHAVTTTQVETQVKKMSERHEHTPQQKTALKKKPLSSQELQTRKMQAMKNRPWLQKTTLKEQKAPANPEQDSSQDPAQAQQIQSQLKKEMVRTSRVASQQSSAGKAHLKAPTKSAKETHQQQQEQKKQKPQPQNVEQQLKKPQQQQKTQQKDTHSAVRQAQADLNTKKKSKILTETQPKTQTKVPNQSQANTRSNLQSAVQLEVQSTSMPHSSTDAHPIAMTKVQTGVSESQIVHSSVTTQLLAQPQTEEYLQSRTLVPAGPQTSVQPQGQAVPQVQAWAQVRPSSPMQVPLPGHIQPPLPSHIQLRSHPQSWAPVRPPSPKPPTHGQPEAQTHAQPMADYQIHPQSRVQHQIHSQAQVSVHSMTYPQTHAQAVSQVQTPPQPKAGPQTHGQPMTGPSQVQPPTHHETQVQPSVLRQGHSMTDSRTHAQPLVQQGLTAQGQLQAMTKVRASSPMSIQHLQATAQPQLYPQGYSTSQFSPQQWPEKQEPQSQAIVHQGHPIPQPYPQHFGQASHSQTYATTQAFRQWTQQGPQTSPHGYSHMGQSYRPQMCLQAPNQPWAQTQPQITSPSPMQQTPQIRAYSMVQTDQVQVQQQTWVQTSPHLQSQPYHLPQSQQYLPVQHQPQTLHHQLQAQVTPQLHPTHPIHPQAQLQSLQAQSQTHIQTQPVLQAKPQVKTLQPEGDVPQPIQSQLQMQPTIQSATQTKPHPQLPPRAVFELSAQAEVELLEHQVPKQPMVLSPTKSVVEPTLQPKVQAEITPPSQPKDQSPIQSQAQEQLQTQSPSQPRAQSTLQSKAQSPPQARPQPLPQLKPQPQPPLQPKPQQPPTAALSQVTVLPEIQPESPELCIKPPTLAQAPPQAYTEAYNKAQALARNGFEEAKYCLQAHIMEAITVFKDKRLSAEQASVKEEILGTLDPELLEGFLRAAKGMEAFCTPSQLRDMEFFSQSVRTQWEACFSADFAEAGQHLEALKELCDTLSPEDAHRLAQTQLMECEKRLAAIQRQFSGDQDTSHTEARIQLAFSEDLTTHKESKKSSDKAQVITEVSQVTTHTTDERPPVSRPVEKQTSVEELPKKEVFERYENCKRTLQAQLAKNQQSFKDVPSDSVSLKGLHTRLQEIQFLRQESEQLWSEFSNQCSQCSQLNRDMFVEQERSELQEQWRSQQTNLQRRGSSLSAALRQIDSTENHMVDFTDRLDRYLRQPKDITGFTLANTNILKDIKELDDNIQSELDQLARLDPESSDLDPRERFPLTREVETHKASLDQLRQQVRKSEAAARALDRFLMSLRTVDEDISGVQGAPCSDSVVLQDCRSKLALIKQSIDSLKEKAPQLDLLLQGARLTVTRDGVPASCLDMVTALLRRLEEADRGLASQQKGLQKETQTKSLGLRKRTMLGELKKLQDTIEEQGLKEPTMPAVQHRLRALSDLEGQLQAQHFDLESLRELQEKQGGENVLQEVEAQWKETERAFVDRKKQCNVLLELLKKFQTCRSHLSNTIQKAEQTVSHQASYMGKDNLQRSMTKVCDIKEELGGLGEQIEEMRGVCKQLQSELKKFPECSETAFEAEADTLMDNWLDVTEKTDAYMDNLQVGLELWEKQLMLGGEVDSWAGAKLALFAESHPFNNEQQVLAMRDEIHANEENIAHFHKKSMEIQEMLQSQEAPLELQVMETQLRKRMEQVKELFTDCTDVFEELVAVRKHLSEKIEECQTAIENIQCCLSKIDASEPKLEAQIQDLCDDLEAQEEQAEAVLKEVTLVSSVASPQVLEELSVDCSRLREAVSRTKDMIHLKREERDKGLLKVINDEKQSFEEWFQDLQLLVNECFENPESRADVETSVQRLNGFLKAKDTERRLDQLKEQLERGSQQFPPQRLSELTSWLKEQQEEVATFRAHCHNRQKQMESLLDDLNCLQKQHDSLCEWLQGKEKESVVSENVKQLLEDLQHESRAETLSELLASVRRQGVRADTLLKDGDNLIQRHRNLEAKLQKQAEAQSALEGEFHRFKTQVESTRTWIWDLSEPLTSSGRDIEMEEMKSRAMAILNSKPEGDSKVKDLRRQMESLCEQEDLEESRKPEAQLFVRDAENEWRTALQTAEEALNKADTQALLAFQSHKESFLSWIKDQNENLTSLGVHMQIEEKINVAQAVLSSRFQGESRLQDLRQQCQSLCDKQGLDTSRRQEIHAAGKHTEEQWWKVLQAAEEALNQAEMEAASERDFVDFKNQNETIQSWIREQKQKLLVLGSHMQFEERLQAAQAVMTSEPEGESKLCELKRQCESLCEHLEENRKLEVEQLVKSTEQQWRTVLQTARQAELRSLLDDFDSQSKNTEFWIRDKQQKLQSVGSHTSPEEKSQVAQVILTSRPEGDVKVNNLRRRGQTLCDHPDADEGRKVQVQQTVKETEEQWRTVLQAAKQLKAAAAAQIAEEAERRALELGEFHTHHQDTDRWLGDLQQQLESLGNQTRPEDRLHAAQAVMSSRPEGDSRIQKLRRQGESLCVQDLEGNKKQEVQQTVRDTVEQWLRVLQDAKEALGQAERQSALDGQLRDFEALMENTKAWLEEKRKRLVYLDCQTDPEQAMNTAQNILSCKPEGDSKLTELRRQSQSLSDQQDLEEHTKHEAEQTVRDLEEHWKTVLQTAENTLKEAEVRYSLSRELEAFWTHAGSTRTWVEGLQKQAQSMQGGTLGSKTEIEERLNTAQAILSSGTNGDAQVTELKKRAQSLCGQKDLEHDKIAEVEQMVRHTETQWRTVVQAAEETQRQLQGVVERLVSYYYKRDQAEARLVELQKQTSSLPHVFPWPGLGERRQAVEQARTLLDQSTALALVVSEVRTQAAELFEITQDQSWTEPSWAGKQESISALLRELTDIVANLERGIQTERQCTLLIEQHQAAQDWLREQVKGLGPPPADRHGLHSAANNLKALLQTVDREQKEMMEMDSARDRLLSLCTPGGQDALTLEVSHLHDLCTNSEQEVRECLKTCEMQLEEMDRELAQMVQGLKERAAALQWELRSLDQALSYSEPQNNIAQLQQHWNSLQNCEKSLEDLGVKVQDLHQEVKSTSSTKELPAYIISVVESLCQQHASLKSRLCEHQGTCSTNTATYLQDCLHALQQWSQNNPSDSVSSVQVALEEGEKLQNSLQEALFHQQFLTACLKPDLLENLQKESSEMLGEVHTHKATLTQSLKVMTAVVPPPRKNKRSLEKQTSSFTEKFASNDELSIPAEAKTSGGTEVVEVTTSASVEQIMTETSIPQETKSKRVKPDEPLTDEPSGIQKATDQSENLLLPSRRKSKTSATETEIPTSLPATAGGASDVVREPESVLGQTETAEVLPPRRKSKSPKLPPKHTDPQAEQMVEEPQSQRPVEEPKLVPVRRKSKNAEPVKQDASQSPEVEPDYHQKIPDTLTSSTQMETEPTETAAMNNNKPSPTKRKSKGQKLLPEYPAETENKQESGSKEASVPSAEQTQPAVEKTNMLPARRKLKDLEVSIETKQEPSPEVVSEPAESTFIPPKRKSRSTELSPSLPTKSPNKSDESSSDLDVQVKPSAAEETARRRSKTADLSQTSETVSVPVVASDAELEQNKKTTKSPAASPDLPHKLETRVLEKSETQIAEDAAMEESKVTGPKSPEEEADSVKLATGLEMKTVLAEKAAVESQAEISSHQTERQVGAASIQNLKEKKVTVFPDADEVFIQTAETLTHEAETSHPEPVKLVTLPDSVTPSKTSEESKRQLKEASEQISVLPKETQPPLSSDTADTKNIADYIDKLWKNTEETQKRYLVLDLPDTEIFQTCEIKQDQVEEEKEAASQRKLSEQVVQQPERGKDDEIQVPTHNIQDSADSQGDIQEPQVRILQLDICTSLEENENTSDSVEAATHSEGVLESSVEDLTLTDSSVSPAKEPQHKTELVEISFYEQNVAKRIEAQPKAVSEYSIQEASVSVEKIHMGPEVRVLQLDIQTSFEELDHLDVRREAELDVVPGKTEAETVEITMEGDGTEYQEYLAQEDSAQLTSIQPHEIRYIEITLDEPNKLSPRQTDAKMATEERCDTEHGVQEEHHEDAAEDLSKKLEEKAFEVEEVQLEAEVLVSTRILEEHENSFILTANETEMGTSQCIKTTTADLQPEKTAEETTREEEKVSERQEDECQSDSTQTVSESKETELESVIQLDTVNESKDVTAAEVRPDESESEMIKGDVQESFSDFLSQPAMLPQVKPDEHKTHDGEKTDGQQDKETEREGEEEEKDVSVEVKLQPSTTATGEMKLQSLTSPQEKMLSGEEISTGSMQAVEKSSMDVVQGEITLLDGLSTGENEEEENVLSSEKLTLDPPDESVMENIFAKIQQLAGSEAISQLIESKPHDDAPETVITSASDLDIQLSRLVSKILSLKNRPAELSPTAMAQQVEEIQACREQVQHQLTLFPQLQEAGAIDRDQWSTTAQDAVAVIQSKEAQLQLVTDYFRQIETAKTTTDRLTAELDAVKTSPQESSNKEVEQLCSFQRSMEENRTVLGELLMTHSKLCLHLSQSDREAALMELKNLQEKWRTLERNIESTLHHTKVISHQTNSLLSELSGLQEHLETIKKDLEATFSSVSQWNCKDAQQLMQANAEVKAAQQQCLYFQQLSEELLHASCWATESKEIQNGLQEIKEKLSYTEELVSSQTKMNSNPTMEKIMAVVRDGLVWAKQTERDIDSRTKRVPLLPEEVHHQLRDLKKLQSEVMTKQGQLETLVEEVTELLPQLDQAEEVPVVHSSLDCLEELSKSTTEKLSKTLKELESGLQTREKLSEQIADLDSWIVANLQSEALRSGDSDLVSQTELDRRGRQIQETLCEAERQTAICEALFISSKDIASELSVTESCQLFDKIRDIQEDIRAISSKEKANKEELDELIKTVDSRYKNLMTVEKSLREILMDLSRHHYLITRESLQAFKPFKHMILEHKSEVDHLIPWIPQEKTRDLNSVIYELQNKILTLEVKAKDHERYLNMRQCVEDLRESFQEEVHQATQDRRSLEDRYKLCHTLLILFPLMKGLCSEARSALQVISADLFPSQLTAEQLRLKQNEESLDTWEMSLSKNLRLIELNVLKELDLESEKKATQIFLLRTQQELQKIPSLEPNQTVINREYQKAVFLKKTVESKMRVLEVLEEKTGSEERRGSEDLMDLKNVVLCECDLQMENILQASECLRGYTSAVKDAAWFLQVTEVSMLPPQGSVRPCCDSLEDTQQALASLQQHFQTYVERLQNQAALQTCLSPQKLKQLHENILSQLLVRVSTLQAKGQVRLDCLSRCAEQYRNYTKSHDEIIQSVTSAESRLLQLISQKVTSLAECTDQEEKLRALSGQMESLLSCLDNLREWCPEQSCRGGREAAVTAVWRRVSRIRRCTQELTTRSTRRISEWLDVTNSVEKASVVLEQVEAGLPGDSRLKASEELQDLLQSWEQYQDRLDCEHRALSALELRAARLLGVPAHLEEAPPTPLCQQLQAMQGRCDSVKQRSSEGLLAARVELEEREKVREELQVLCGWLEAVQSLLSDVEKSSRTEELLEIHGQLSVHKSVLQRIMEQVKMKYSDVYSLVPIEIDSQLQEVTRSMEEVELKVGEAVEKRGPVSSLGVKLFDIQAGLRSVQKTLEERSPTVTDAKNTQKHVWDQLDVWHSRLAALEVEMQDLEKPEEALILTERLVEVQQLHSLLAKQAEQRTTLLSKIHTWLQEHQEMINSSKSWMAEAQSWLAAPCTYTTAKCLSSHVNALQLVLSDAAQIRSTLQGFSSVLKEMSQVCDITALQEQLTEADRQVADVQDGFTAPLSQLEHAAAEVEAIESEVKRMESNVVEIKALLSSPESLTKHREERFKMIEQMIQPMRRTVAEIQKCKPGLCLPKKAQETLTVFTVVDQLQTLLLELEKKVPALFIQEPPTQTQTKLQKSVSGEAEKEEQGQIRIVHFEEDVVKRSGGTLQNVGQSFVNIQWEHQGMLQAEEDTDTKEKEELRVEDAGRSVLWWLWDAFLGASPEVPLLVVSEETEAAAGQSAAEEKKDVVGSNDTAEASSPEALSKPLGTVKTQALSESMVNPASTENISKSDPRSQQRCVVS